MLKNGKNFCAIYPTTIVRQLLSAMFKAEFILYFSSFKFRTKHNTFDSVDQPSIYSTLNPLCSLLFVHLSRKIRTFYEAELLNTNLTTLKRGSP